MEFFELFGYVIIEICCALFTSDEKGAQATIAQRVSGLLLMLILAGFALLLLWATG
jgi:hypothetical protein